MKYPDALGVDSVSDYCPMPGATYGYTYDAMGWPITLADDRQTPVNWVTNVQYGASNELKQIDYQIATGLKSGMPTKSCERLWPLRRWCTDNTGRSIHGQAAHLIAFDTDPFASAICRK